MYAKAVVNESNEKTTNVTKTQLKLRSIPKMRARFTSSPFKLTMTTDNKSNEHTRSKSKNLRSRYD